jgi:uncharacterized phage protein (TIGR01671 family)
MRDIKFRAWDEENKTMIQWHDTFFYDTSAVTNWSGDFSYIKMPLMQYTGLKDKNNKEIYEGDIVRYLDEIDGETELFGFVEWERCWWSVNLHPDFLRENDIMDTDEYLTYEVVGNIYENKDMIYWIK